MSSLSAPLPLALHDGDLPRLRLPSLAAIWDRYVVALAPGHTVPAAIWAQSSRGTGL